VRRGFGVRAGKDCRAYRRPGAADLRAADLESERKIGAGFGNSCLPRGNYIPTGFAFKRERPILRDFALIIPCGIPDHARSPASKNEFLGP